MTIQFKEGEVIDLRQVKFRIENADGAIVAELTDFGGDAVIIYSDSPMLSAYDVDNERHFGVVQSLMSGHIVDDSEPDMGLVEAMRLAFSLLATELHEASPRVLVMVD